MLVVPDQRLNRAPSLRRLRAWERRQLRLAQPPLHPRERQQQQQLIAQEGPPVVELYL